MQMEFMGRNVLLVDDSIVRGTTSREIVTMARQSGAKKVHFASCAPPITHTHIYGIDLASPSELVAHNFVGDSAIAEHIGADSVVYQTLDDLKASCTDAAKEAGNSDAPRNFEVGVFCGSYITPVDEGYFDHLESIRGQSRKLKVADEARRAVAQGVASQDQLEMAANGVTVNSSGKVVAAVNGNADAPTVRTNGVGGVRKSVPGTLEEQSPSVLASMDIALHNYNDFAQND